MDFEQLAASVGLSVGIFKFILCLVASLPISYFHRFVPAAVRHQYGLASGALLCAVAYGPSSLLFLCVPIICTYLAMLAARPYCGYIVFCGSFSFLIWCHHTNLSGDQWRKGNIDLTGSLMVLTLKITSAAIDYQDGLLPEEKAQHPRHRNRLLERPTLLALFGYCFCCGSILIGPVFELRNYLCFTLRTKEYARLEAAPIAGPVLLRLLRCAVALALHTALTPLVPASLLREAPFFHLPLWSRYGYVYLVTLHFRIGYYFVWSLGEAALILAGVGFAGWEGEGAAERASWERAVNMRPLRFEQCSSTTRLPHEWNMRVGSWLRTYVYDRLTPASQRPTFWQLLVTQGISALWHGLYPGYYLFFMNAALGQEASKIVFRFQKQLASQKAPVLQWIVYVVHTLFTNLILTYSQAAFVLLSVEASLPIWRSLYFAGTIAPLLVIFGLPPLLAARAKRQTAKKAE